jgi:rubrerythrin
MEQQAEVFYRHLAEHTNHAGVKQLCYELADEEKAHQILIQNKLSRWKSYPVIQMELDVLDTDKNLRNLFLSPPDRDAAMEEFVEYAIDQENKMVSFYAGFEADFAQPGGLKSLIELIAAQRAHVSKWMEQRRSFRYRG